MTTPLNPIDNKDNKVGFLVSKDYNYRLVPVQAEFNWFCGVFSSNIFDKSYQISAQGVNSTRINANLTFDLSEDEADNMIHNFKMNQVNTVMTPSSYIDPSGILKEMLLYIDNLTITNAENGRINLSLALVTDTASTITKWRDSFFINVRTFDENDNGTKNNLEKYDIVYSDKVFYYMLDEVIDTDLIEKYNGDIVDAAKAEGKKYVLPLEVITPFERQLSPDYYINDFKESYPVRAWKGEQTYNFQDVSVNIPSLEKKQLLCCLHFLEHQYGYKNFRIPQIENDSYWWNTQKWTHVWNVGDYHSLNISINQNHAPRNYK